MKVAFVAGGSGGHVYPAIAIAQALKQRDAETQIIFFTSRQELERKVLTDHGFPFISFFNGNVFTGFWVSLYLLAKNRPDRLINMGSVIGAVVAVAAYLLRIPMLTHECNIVAGRATRFTGYFSRMVTVPVKETQKYFGPKAVVTGNPVRKTIGKIDRARAAGQLQVDPQKFTVLVLGGSQGALKINELIPELIKLLPENFQFLHITGMRDHERIRNMALTLIPQRMRQNYFIYPFVADPAALYAAADVAVSRAGAGVLAELAAAGVPSILIPYPYAADNHQEINARRFSQAGAVELILNRELSVGQLSSIIKSLAASPQNLLDMRAKTLALGWPEAADRIADMIYKGIKA